MTAARVADRSRTETLLGSGGMADVHLAHDDERGQAVAIKVLRQAEAVDLARFGAEAHALRRLSHPAVVRLRDSGTWDGKPYLVMDLVEGLSLAERLKAGPLEAEATRSLGWRLAGGLDHAHGLGVTHRDVKPANVLHDAEGQPHLADFGIARMADTTGLTQTGMVMGTAAYLAPEQLQGHAVGPPAGIYALGLVLLECHTGRRACDGPATEAALARLTRSPAIPEELPAWWRRLIEAMTATDAPRRPTAAQVVDALAAAGAADRDPAATEAMAARAGDTAVIDPAALAEPATRRPPPDAWAPDQRPRPVGPPASRRWLVALLVLVVVAVLAVAVVVGLDGGSSPGPDPVVVDDLPAELRDALDRLAESVR